ncbi:MAG: transporter [Candidatus Sulfobium sp.]
MRRFILTCVACFLILSTPLPAGAYIGLCCGKCGGNMPMNIPNAGIAETYEFRFKLSPQFMKMGGLMDGTHSVDADTLLGMPVMNGMPTGKYMAVPTGMDMYMTSLSAGYSFSDNLFVAMMFMWMKKDMEMKFSSMMKTQTGLDGFNMKTEGMGDTMLMAKYELYANDPLIPSKEASLYLGVSLPTGSINERNSDHPLAMRRRELVPYGMQLGSGTFDPIVGALYQGSASPYWWGVDAFYTARLYDNSRDYRLGDEFRYDVWGMYQFRYDLLAQLQLNGKSWGKIHGMMDESATGASGHVTQGDPSSPFTTPLWDPSNYGGNQLSVTAGFQWQPFPMHILDFQVGVPIYRDLNGPQPKEDYRVMFTWYIELPTPASVRYEGGGNGKKSKLGF